MPTEEEQEKQRNIGIGINRDMFMGAARDSWNLSNEKLDDLAKLFMQVAFVVGGLSATLLTNTSTITSLVRVKVSLVFFFISVLAGLIQTYIDHLFYARQKTELLAVAEPWCKLMNDTKQFHVWDEAEERWKKYQALPQTSNRAALVIQIVFALVATALVVSGLVGLNLSFT